MRNVLASGPATSFAYATAACGGLTVDRSAQYSFNRAESSIRVLKPQALTQQFTHAAFARKANGMRSPTVSV